MQCPYRLFGVTGIELEYAVVDAALEPRCLVEDAFRSMAGHPTSQCEFGPVGYSNELAAHVLETKLARPQSSLTVAERQLHRGIRALARVLGDNFEARLLPIGMHPFMRPSQTELWRRAGRRIYATYAKVFDIREHGWLNVQSCHVNLPFGRSGRETVLLYNATALLMPYLPALAASSAVVAGRLGPCLDNRLTYYARNQRQLPIISGRVVPQPIDSLAAYHREVLQPIYRALRAVPGGRTLCHEWVNSRGAILRFQRQALELRVLDIQECVRMDLALAAFVRASLKWMVRELDGGGLRFPAHRMLVADFANVIREGRHANVDAGHLRPFLGPRLKLRAGTVVEGLLRLARQTASADERRFLTFAEQRADQGSIAEMMRRRLGGRHTAGGRQRARIRDAHEELIHCLEENRPWRG